MLIMNRFRKHKHSGFTIVELVVVIIIIGILATVTVVGYGSIRKTAYNIQVIAGVSQYRETIEAYKAFYKKYPQTTRELANEQVAVVCLGTGYPDKYCGIVTGVETYEDAAFADELGKIGRGGPVSSINLRVNGETFIGAVYGIDVVPYSVSPTKWARTIQYALQGKNADCGIEDAWSYALQDNPATTACEIDLESVPAR